MSNFKIKFHKNLTIEDWAKQNIFEIMGNIGSEISRTLKWKDLKKEEIWKAAFDRSLELFDLTKEIKTLTPPQLNEILRAREVWADYIVGDNNYNSDNNSIQKYFDEFAYAARNINNQL